MEIELRCIVDALPGLIWTARLDGHIDFLNQRWCEYTGLSVDEAYGRGWQTAIHPDDLPELLERWRSILASRESREMEARLRRFDGEYRWFLFRINPLIDASGQVVKWCGMNTDIEDRRRSEETQRAHWWLSSSAREHHFRSVGDDIPGLATLMTPAGEVEIANRQVLEYFGATLKELKGWAIADTVHPDDLPDILAAWRGAVESGHPYDAVARLRRADGVYRWFHTHGFPLRDTDGRIVLWYLLQTDVDDRKRSEALLAGEKQLLEMVAGGHSMSEILEAICRLVESTAGGCYCSVLLTDPSGTRVEHGAAPSFPASFINSIIGRPLKIDEGPCGLAVRLNEQVIVADLTTETRWPDLRRLILAHGLRSCWSTPISSAAGKILGTFGVYYREPKTPTSLHQSLLEQFKHIARIAIERRLSEEALSKVRSELAHVARAQSLGVLTASIAHEVNQPLSGIITNANTCLRMLAADPPNVDGARETARRTIRDGNRAADVVTRLRALFSRKDATTEPVDLNEAAREVIALSLSELQRSRVILRPELADILPPVTGDRVQLQQVILNLLLNATEAMSSVNDRPRQLVIRTERDEGDRVRLTVQDAGVGLDPQGADKLFEAFYSTKSGGMGIGLSVSRSIIESHHGRLWAAPNDGPGATFAFSIPRAPDGVTNANSLGAVRTSPARVAQHVMRNP
ncbi:MAG TPA: PAS domain-containing protein [Candidatus Acidoferrum sp.]|nr:PAS domain-containing protein [Candidatus Acidoferrum sp.]